MKIDVRGLIGELGEQREYDLSVPVASGGGDGIRFEPARLRLTLTATPDGILADGELTSAAQLTCSRCLGGFQEKIVTQLEHLFTTGGTTDGPDEGVATAGEIDEAAPDGGDGDEIDKSPLEGGEIDLGPLVAEVLELALPMKPLCRADCEGLCATCGHPLRDGPCDCAAEDLDPRLAVLGDLFKRIGDDDENKPPDGAGEERKG